MSFFICFVLAAAVCYAALKMVKTIIAEEPSALGWFIAFSGCASALVFGVQMELNPLSGYYQAETSRICRTDSRTRDGLLQLDALVDLQEFRECVEAAKLGVKLSHAWETNAAIGLPASQHEDFWVLAKQKLRRALELRQRLSAVDLPKEDLLFLAYQESLLTK